MGDNELLTVRGTTPITGYSAARTYQLIKESRLPAVRYGRSIRIPRRALEQWLDEQAEQALAGCRQESGR